MEQLTSAQLSEWEAYDRLDPIGSWRMDHGFAQVISEVVNIVNQLYPKEGTKPIITSPIEFMPVWDKVQRQKLIKQRELENTQKQSAEDMKAFLTSFAQRHNEKVAGISIPPIKRKS